MHHVDFGSVADVSEVHSASFLRVEVCREGESFVSVYMNLHILNYIYAVKMEATLPTSSWCEHLRAELTSPVNHHESM
jgi:hypothetical protein